MVPTLPPPRVVLGNPRGTGVGGNMGLLSDRTRRGGLRPAFCKRQSQVWLPSVWGLSLPPPTWGRTHE